jgi:hypothetical protein
MNRDSIRSIGVASHAHERQRREEARGDSRREVIFWLLALALFLSAVALMVLGSSP